MMRHALTTMIATAVISMAVPAQATSITDGNFSGWAFSSYQLTLPMGTATATLEASGGNPDARLLINTVTGNQEAYASALKQDFSTTAALSGAFTLSLNVLHGAGAFGQGQAIGLLIEQNGSLYHSALGVTGFPHAQWDTVIFSGSFTPALFSRVSGAAPLSPDFSGGVVTRFGFGAGNAFSGNLSMYYDNFSLQYSDVSTAVPEPTSLLLVLSGAAVGLRARSRARRRSRRS